MHPFEFQNAVEGYEDSRREEWTMQRLFTAAIVQSNSTKPVDPQKLIKFPWETTKEGAAKIISGEDVQRILAERNRLK